MPKTHALYLPVDTKAGAAYQKWDETKKLSDALNTVRSAKDFFFPQTENLMDFKVEGKNIDIIDTRSECEDFVVFGVRACDVKSFEVLDRVFLAEPCRFLLQEPPRARRYHVPCLHKACRDLLLRHVRYRRDRARGRCGMLENGRRAVYERSQRKG